MIRSAECPYCSRGCAAAIRRHRRDHAAGLHRPGGVPAPRAAAQGLATAINVTDGAGAKVHLSSLAAAHFLVQSGIEPIFQMTCRDRNRLALQGDLLGAAALGIHNILVLAGDDPKLGDQPDAKPVYDLDSRALIALARKMSDEGVLPSGTPIEEKLDLFVGAADVPIDPPPGWTPKA